MAKRPTKTGHGQDWCDHKGCNNGNICGGKAKPHKSTRFPSITEAINEQPSKQDNILNIQAPIQNKHNSAKRKTFELDEALAHGFLKNTSKEDLELIQEKLDEELQNGNITEETYNKHIRGLCLNQKEYPEHLILKAFDEYRIDMEDFFKSPNLPVKYLQPDHLRKTIEEDSMGLLSPKEIRAKEVILSCFAYKNPKINTTLLKKHAKHKIEQYLHYRKKGDNVVAQRELGSQITAICSNPNLTEKDLLEIRSQFPKEHVKVIEGACLENINCPKSILDNFTAQDFVNHPSLIKNTPKLSSEVLGELYKCSDFEIKKPAMLHPNAPKEAKIEALSYLNNRCDQIRSDLNNPQLDIKDKSLHIAQLLQDEIDKERIINSLKEEDKSLGNLADLLSPR